MSHTVLVLGTELGSSARIVRCILFLRNIYFIILNYLAMCDYVCVNEGVSEPRDVQSPCRQLQTSQT